MHATIYSDVYIYPTFSPDRARTLLDPGGYRVSEGPRCIFHRILSLYSLSNWWEERESDKGQHIPQLTSVLLRNTGRLVFPIFSIIRQRAIFRSRDDLLHFEVVCGIEAKMAEAFSDKDWFTAKEITKEAIGVYDETLNDEELTRHSQELPTFLRKFTSGSVLAYILTKGVEVNERLKCYQDAVDLLRKLLKQDLYLPDFHGLWYERLVLDLDQHLKKPQSALEAIWQSLDDLHVQEARLLTICQRVTKLANVKKNCLLTREERLKFEDHSRWLSPQEPILVTIQGKMMPKANVPGEKTVFLREGRDQSLLCSVEEYAREHYKAEHAYTNGIHGEGAIVNTIAVIIFWDIIFDVDIPDAFRSPHQAAPLDFNSSEFYSSRKDHIEKRLEDITEWPQDKLCNFVSDRWESSSGVTSSPAHWDMFSSLTHFLGLLKCFSGHQLSGICRRLMTNHRHTRSGFPDLTMWDTNKGRVTFVEVKGPNDRLSNKQILWLDYLNSLGIEAVVCHIEAMNAKRLSSSP
jgi:Fanconi-associated nuclease 1